MCDRKKLYNWIRQVHYEDVYNAKAIHADTFPAKPSYAEVRHHLVQACMMSLPTITASTQLPACLKLTSSMENFKLVERAWNYHLSLHEFGRGVLSAKACNRF